jgi:hypothetical protein
MIERESRKNVRTPRDENEEKFVERRKIWLMERVCQQKQRT